MESSVPPQAENPNQQDDVTAESQDKNVKVVKPEQPEIQPQQNIKFETFERAGWRFFHSTYSMSSEKEMDLVADQVGIQGLPSVFYGFNHLYITNEQHNICLDFNSIDSLSYGSFQKQKLFVKNPSETKPEEGLDLDKIEKLLLTNSSLQDNEKALNLIDLIP